MKSRSLQRRKEVSVKKNDECVSDDSCLTDAAQFDSFGLPMIFTNPALCIRRILKCKNKLKCLIYSNNLSIYQQANYGKNDRSENQKKG